MSQKFKNSRQKAQMNSGSICKLFNALVLNFCHNPKGSYQFCLLAAQKFFFNRTTIRSKILLASKAKLDWLQNLLMSNKSN
jgi:hypothetical protein